MTERSVGTSWNDEEHKPYSSQLLKYWQQFKIGNRILALQRVVLPTAEATFGAGSILFHRECETALPHRGHDASVA